MDCTYSFANRAEESETSTDHGTAAGMYVNLHIQFGASQECVLVATKLNNI